MNTAVDHKPLIVRAGGIVMTFDDWLRSDFQSAEILSDEEVEAGRQRFIEECHQKVIAAFESVGLHRVT